MMIRHRRKDTLFENNLSWIYIYPKNYFPRFPRSAAQQNKKAEFNNN